MAIDLALLRIIKHKANFTKVAGYIPHSAIDKRTKAVTQDISRYFEEYPEESKIDFPAFRSLFFTVWHKGLKEEDTRFYNELLTRMEQDVSAEIQAGIINRLIELEFATGVANVVQDYEAGEEVSILECIEERLHAAKKKLEIGSKFEYADITTAAVHGRSDDDGLEWPVGCLNDTYRRIQGGDQYIIAARPGKGKTSFLTHLCYSMNTGLDPSKIIVWFNNESQKAKILQRLAQSVLNATQDQLQALDKAGTLIKEYTKVMHRIDRVRVYDVHGWNNNQLEAVIDSVGHQNVGALIFDMLDNVRFPGLKDAREDQRLEAMYQWSRELAVRLDVPAFATSQISNEGSGLLFPPESALKESKSGKQGACDGILMIGTSDDPLLAQKRGLSMPKTKSKRAGQPNLREEVLFDEDRGRYIYV